MVISAWDRSVSLDSPDGALNARIEHAEECGMGSPRRGELVISNGLVFQDCGPPIVWSDDSLYLAAPQWQPLNRGFGQRILVISMEHRVSRPVGKVFGVLQLESFSNGIVRGVERPRNERKTVEIDTRLINWQSRP